MDAVYQQRGEAIDYTPNSDVAAGQVVKLNESSSDNSFIGIAKTDIKAGELGALAIEGVFRFTNFDGDVELWSPVSWSHPTRKVIRITGNSASTVELGLVVGVYDGAIDVKLMRGLVPPEET